MKDPKPLSEQNATPDDVATLYSWANLHGAKYRDFSAARAQTREKARLRAEQAILEQQRQLHSEPVAPEVELPAAEADAAAQVPIPDAVQAIEEHKAVDEFKTASEFKTADESQLDASAQLQQEDPLPEQRQQAELLQDGIEQARIEQDGIEQVRIEPVLIERGLIEQNQAQSEQTPVAPKVDAETEEAGDARAQEGSSLTAHPVADEAALEAAHRAEFTAQLAAAQQAAEQAAMIEAEQAARRAAEEAAEMAALKTAQRARDHAAYLAEQEAAQRLVQRAAEPQMSQQRTWQQQPPAVRFPPRPTAPYSGPLAQNVEYEDFSRPRPSGPGSGTFSSLLPDAPASNLTRTESGRDAGPAPRNPLPREAWSGSARPGSEGREPAFRPAWLNAESRPAPGPFAPPLVSPVPNPSVANPFAPAGLPPAPAAQPASASLSAAPGETLQGSRDRLTARWFALRGVFEPAAPAPDVPQAPVVSWPPTLAVFSLAGGVGKTSLVATLGRALSARGERVLLVDTAAFGLLPFFFGATDQRPGMLRIFAPPLDSNDAPVQMVTLDPDGLGGDQTNPESLSGEIAKYTRGAGRILIDLATASGATTRRIMRMAPLVLVPVIADMSSVVSVSSIDSFFAYHHNGAGKPALPYYVLNQFDASLPLHLDVREVLREQLGGRLLPFALRRASAMSEALAEGMTVMDYAPSSTLAEDFNTLAGWVRSLAAPASVDPGVRWSER